MEGTQNWSEHIDIGTKTPDTEVIKETLIES